MTDSYTTPPGWYVDPTGQGNARYWNGSSWTQTVNRGGVVLNVYIDPNQAQVPPTPGTQVAPPVAPPPRPTASPVSSSHNSVVGVVLGVVAVLFFVLMMFAIISNDGSNEDTPDVTIVQPEPEQPAPEATTPAVEAPTDTAGG
jgi:hypothetical protein